jgi:hypothetical protein
MPAADVHCSVPDPRVPLILADALFVVVDDGAAVATDYPILERIVIHEAKRFPNGIAGLIIVPRNARPPREEIRAAIRETLRNVGKHIRSICWYVEGSGFQGASQRAVLSGLVMLLQPPYPAHIASELRGALAWSYAKTGSPPHDLDAIAEQIRALRVTVDRKLLQGPT